MCHPQVIRSRQLIRHDGGNALKSQDNREGLGALPLKAMECGNLTYLFAFLLGDSSDRILVIAASEWTLKLA